MSTWFAGSKDDMEGAYESRRECHKVPDLTNDKVINVLVNYIAEQVDANTVNPCVKCPRYSKCPSANEYCGSVKAVSENILSWAKQKTKEYTLEELCALNLPANTLVESVETGARADICYDDRYGMTLKKWTPYYGFPAVEIKGKWVILKVGDTPAGNNL